MANQADEVETGPGEPRQTGQDGSLPVGIHGLQQTADLIRADILRMTSTAGSGHPGGSMSAADLMCVLFFSGIIRHDPLRPKWPKRDRFILSKGHVAPVLYAAMARSGYFPLSELLTLRQLDSRLQGHPDRLKLPGIEVSGGSLGQGLSIAVGLAYALAHDPSASKDAEALVPPARGPFVFTLLGDGECQEGQVWEAAMLAGHLRLENLVAIVDNNGLQIDGRLADVVDVGSLAGKFSQFGWQVWEVDGHDLGQIHQALADAVSSGCAQPRMIVAKTVKGKGVSFMEDKAAWHGKALDPGQLAAALAELGEYGTEDADD